MPSILVNLFLIEPVNCILSEKKMINQSFWVAKFKAQKLKVKHSKSLKF